MSTTAWSRYDAVVIRSTNRSAKWARERELTGQDHKTEDNIRNAVLAVGSTADRQIVDQAVQIIADGHGEASTPDLPLYEVMEQAGVEVFYLRDNDELDSE